MDWIEVSWALVIPVIGMLGVAWLWLEERKR